MPGFRVTGAGVAGGLLILMGAVIWLGLPRMAAAENLPVSVQRYSQACAKTGGAITNGLNSGGTGTLYCLWATRRDGTECKVGSNQVNVCTIRCSTDACSAANPRKERPTWPLNGGPGRKLNVAPTLTPDTLAPAN